MCIVLGFMFEESVHEVELFLRAEFNEPVASLFLEPKLWPPTILSNLILPTLALMFPIKNSISSDLNVLSVQLIFVEKNILQYLSLGDKDMSKIICLKDAQVERCSLDFGQNILFADTYCYTLIEQLYMPDDLFKDCV